MHATISVSIRVVVVLVTAVISSVDLPSDAHASLCQNYYVSIYPVLVDPSAPPSHGHNQVPIWYQNLRFWSGVTATAALVYAILFRRSGAKTVFGRARVNVRVHSNGNANQ